jgi:hypothetical protein
VKIRPVAFFQARFPEDDHIEEDGEIIQFGGRNVADALVAVLSSHDFSTTKPEHEEHYGWTFYASKNKVEIWLKVQVIDESENYLDTSMKKGLFFQKERQEIYADALRIISAAMKDDVRFSGVLWHTLGVPDGEVGWAEPDRP